MSSILAFAQSPACMVNDSLHFGTGNSFPMLILGDSTTWGNGLADTPNKNKFHKFGSLVAQWIADAQKVRVDLVVLAHSAATLEDNGQDDGRRFPGSANYRYPVVVKQAQCLNEQDRNQVKLVLLDGCLNDVGAFEIVNPSRNEAWVRNSTTEHCGDPVRTMLTQVATLYPNALIVITGYFPIISEKSDIADLLNFFRQFFPQDRTSMRLQTYRARAVPSEAIQARSTSAGNAKLFYDLSNQLISDAVAAANAALSSKRIVFVEVRFGPNNAFGAPKAWLWPIPTVFSGFDEEYFERQAPCLQAYFGEFAGFETCRIDSTGHPNITGASAYACSIERVLTQTWQLPDGATPTDCPVPE